MGGYTSSQIKLLALGLIAISLPLCFILIIFVINFGGGR